MHVARTSAPVGIVVTTDFWQLPEGVIDGLLQHFDERSTCDSIAKRGMLATADAALHHLIAEGHVLPTLPAPSFSLQSNYEYSRRTQVIADDLAEAFVRAGWPRWGQERSRFISWTDDRESFNAAADAEFDDLADGELDDEIDDSDFSEFEVERRYLYDQVRPTRRRPNHAKTPASRATALSPQSMRLADSRPSQSETPHLNAVTLPKRLGLPVELEDLSKTEIRRYRDLRRQLQAGSRPSSACGAKLVRLYVKEVLASDDLDGIIEVLAAVIAEFPEIADEIDLFTEYISDTYVLKGDLERAVTSFPVPPEGLRSTHAIDAHLSLKILAGMRIIGSDVLDLAHRTTLPRFSQPFADDIAPFVQRMLDEANWCALVEEWTAASTPYQIRVYRGIATKHETVLQAWSFATSETARGQARDLVRAAERAWRDDRGIPHVTCWPNPETRFHFGLVAALAGEAIERDAKRDWLGVHSLDAFVPRLRVAVCFNRPGPKAQPALFEGDSTAPHTSAAASERARRCAEAGVQIIMIGADEDPRSVARQAIELGSASA